MQKVLIIGAGLVFAAGTALADDPNGTNGGSAAPAPSAGGVTAVEPAAADAWPGAVIDRPYALPAKGITAYGDVQILEVSLPNPLTGGSTSSTAEGLDIGGAYGITDKITAGASYQFTLNDDSGSFPNNGKGPLDVYGSYSIMHTAKLNVAVGADLVADFGASDAMGSTTNFAVDAGIAVRYAVIPQVAVYTGSPMLPGPVGQQLTLGLNNNQEGKLQLPVGVGVQALPQLFAFAQTSLFEVLVANAPMGADSFSAIGSNQFGIPLLAGAYYNVNKILDIGAFVNFPDLNHAGDLYDIGVGARWYK